MKIAGRDGAWFDAHVATPPDGAGPGIVVLTPIFGLEPGMQEVVERFAARGYVVMAPDLFSRSIAGVLPRTKEGQALALQRKSLIDPSTCLGDVAACIETLRELPGCEGGVGVIGYCFGGRYAFLAAADLQIDAAAALHPTEIGITLDAATRITVPLSLHFGADDALVTGAEVEAITQALADNPTTEIYTYLHAAHSFAVPETPSYNAEVTGEAEARIFSLFDELL